MKVINLQLTKPNYFCNQYFAYNSGNKYPVCQNTWHILRILQNIATKQLAKALYWEKIFYK